MNKRKEIAIGLVTGMIANAFGVLVYTLVFFPRSFGEVVSTAHESGYLGAIIAIGAIPGLAAFFGFIKIGRDLRARGVMLWTLAVAIFVLAYKLIA